MSADSFVGEGLTLSPYKEALAECDRLRAVLLGHQTDMNRELDAHRITIDTVYRLRTLLTEIEDHPGMHSLGLDIRNKVNAALRGEQ